MARYIAKNLVVAGVCERVTIQLSYAMGISSPISIMVDTHATAEVEEFKIEECITELFDLTPSGIIKTLDLLRPIYRKTACYGHFGRENENFRWEKTDRVKEIKEYLF
jgi:S-adenosylmethionine synthetase